VNENYQNTLAVNIDAKKFGLPEWRKGGNEAGKMAAIIARRLTRKFI